METCRAPTGPWPPSQETLSGQSPSGLQDTPELGRWGQWKWEPHPTFPRHFPPPRGFPPRKSLLMANFDRWVPGSGNRRGTLPRRTPSRGAAGAKRLAQVQGRHPHWAPETVRIIQEERGAVLGPRPGSGPAPPVAPPQLWPAPPSGSAPSRPLTRSFAFSPSQLRITAKGDSWVPCWRSDWASALSPPRPGFDARLGNQPKIITATTRFRATARFTGEKTSTENGGTSELPPRVGGSA